MRRSYPSLLDSFEVAEEPRELRLADLARGDFVGVERQIEALGLAEAAAICSSAFRAPAAVRRSWRACPAPLHGAVTGMPTCAVCSHRPWRERLIFDLGLVRSLGYYTGAVFQVYDPAYGVPLGSGGRYDELLGTFGRPLPAVGFALNVERVHIALTGEERLASGTTP